MTLTVVNPPVLGTVIKFSATILANNNSVTITHNLGRQARVTGVYGTNNEVNVLKIINQGINSFDVAFAQGITPFADCPVEGTYV